MLDVTPLLAVAAVGLPAVPGAFVMVLVFWAVRLFHVGDLPPVRCIALRWKWRCRALLPLRKTSGLFVLLGATVGAAAGAAALFIVPDGLVVFCAILASGAIVDKTNAATRPNAIDFLMADPSLLCCRRIN